MRGHSLIVRSREDLSSKNSNNPSIKNLAETEMDVSNLGSNSEWTADVAILLRKTLKAEFDKSGKTASGIKILDAGWDWRLGTASIDPVSSAENEERFVFTYGNKLKNKMNLQISLLGELKFTIVKNQNNKIRLEKIETNRPLLDAIVMGKNIELLSLVRRHFLKSKGNISVYQEDIENALKKPDISTMKKIALRTLLAAIEAIKSPPSYNSKLNAPFQEGIDALIYAAWELYNEAPENIDSGLERYASTLQKLKLVLFDKETTHTLIKIIVSLESEINPQFELKKIESELRTNMCTLATDIIRQIKNTAITDGIEVLINETDVNTELAIKNPDGLFYEKRRRLEVSQKVMSSFLKEEENDPSAGQYDAKLAAAISEVNALLYFKKSASGKDLLDSIPSILPHDSKNTRKATTIYAVIENAKRELAGDSKLPQWLQVLKRFLQPVLYQQDQLRMALRKIVETDKEALIDKLSRIEKATFAAIAKSKPGPWAFWRAPRKEEEFQKIMLQTKALCTIQAFSRSEIFEEKLIEELNLSSQSALVFAKNNKLSKKLKDAGELALAVAKSIQDKFIANEIAANTYQIETDKLRREEYQEPAESQNSTEKALETEKAANDENAHLQRQARFGEQWKVLYSKRRDMAAGRAAAPILGSVAGVPQENKLESNSVTLKV